MDDGDGMHAHKGFEAFFQHGAIHIVAIGVGPIKYNQGLPLFCTGFHYVVERADVGKKPYAHIL